MQGNFEDFLHLYNLELVLSGFLYCIKNRTFLAAQEVVVYVIRTSSLQVIPLLLMAVDVKHPVPKGYGARAESLRQQQTGGPIGINL